MLSPLETGTIRGHPGTREGRETGTPCGYPVPAGGPRCRVGRATGRPGPARPDETPSISYMEGASFHYAR